MDSAKLDQLKEVLNQTWDEDTCFPNSWDESNPCKGQCEPTACVVQDLLGGDIYKIVGDESIGAKGAHFFNVIDGEIVDLTAAQFDGPVAYGKGYKVEGIALGQLRTHGRYNRRQRYENLKGRVAAVMEYPEVAACGLNTEEK